MAEASGSHVTPTEAAEHYVNHYYKMLQDQPYIVHRCFRDNSTMLRVDGNKKETATTILQIQELVATLDVKRIEMRTKQSLEFWNGRVLVIVWGSVHIKDFIGLKMFQEIFILSPHEKEYYILTDFFQYFDEEPIVQHLVTLADMHLDAGSNAVKQVAEVAQEETALTAGGKEPLPVEEALASDDVAPADNILYIGNFPFSYDKAKLTSVVQEFARPKLVEIVCSRKSGTSRGFAYVTMSSVEECNQVIEKLHGREYDGRAFRVCTKGKPRSNEPRHFLTITNLHWSVTSEDLTREFERYGKVIKASVLYDTEKFISCGCGYVAYAKRAEMVAALAALNGAELKRRRMNIEIISTY